MELGPEITLFVEFAVPTLLIIVFACSHLLRKSLTKNIVFTLAVLQISTVSFRPETYNSDTWNYSGYIDALSAASGLEFFLVTKFEPLHLLLGAMTQQFRLWLVLEGVLAIILVRYLLRRIDRPESMAVVLGCALPLMSSSVRFGIGLLAVSCALLAFRRSFPKFVAVSMWGAATHVSLCVAGLFQRRRWFVVWGVLIAFFVVAYAIAAILQRAGVSEESDAGPTGIRSFVCLFAFMLYLRWHLREYRVRGFNSDLLSATGIFALSLFFFPVINRWIILLLIIVAVEADAWMRTARVSKRTGSLAAFLVYGALTIPFMYSVAHQVSAGEWFVDVGRRSHSLPIGELETGGEPSFRSAV